MRYAIITETRHYNSPAHHEIHPDHDGREAPLCDSLPDAVAATPVEPGPMRIAPDESGHDTAPWRVVAEIDPRDWSTWPSVLLDAATALCESIGIDPGDAEAVAASGRDVPAEAAASLGMCVAPRDGDAPALLCERPTPTR